MKYIFSLLAVPIFAASSYAQQTNQAVINSTGQTYTQNTGVIFEWSVGEMVLVESMINSKAIITNGLLQPIIASQTLSPGFFVNATNILSPNGDGRNDVWVVEDIEKYPDNEVTVFDRAGRTVFSTRNYQNDWTGHLNGTRLVEGTYYYIIKLNKNGKSGIIKGFITILN
ncbi:hypothetical protein PBAL39_00030 [Pedobacter sp. BAL39]|uniref:gliding motility-associated C-terminal domain-containing protein n=1 Tax=Pedobacter sp. BAL39 TaxID=391596 RepID=UPI0001559D66|nr:T9SS C-terminal target domain-containing protein [Pedobacter sp. BAL39]EDM34872.1 hypothetical protein PBAL39_00030 [Pedobacter sp. BAL39]